MLEYLLDKKELLESLKYDEITEQDLIHYKDIIFLLNQINNYYNSSLDEITDYCLSSED